MGGHLSAARHGVEPAHPLGDSLDMMLRYYLDQVAAAACELVPGGQT